MRYQAIERYRQMVIRAVQMAVWQRQGSALVILHSDQGKSRWIQLVVATPLIMKVFHGTTRRVDAAIDAARCDALTWRAIASA